MSSILLLPEFTLTTGVRADEDLLLAIQFTLADGSTPISIPSSAIFTIQGVASASVANGQITALGLAGNVMLINIPAAAKASWSAGTRSLSLQVNDGQYTRELLTNSTIAIGSAQNPTETPLANAYGSNGALATLLTPAQIGALQGGAMTSGSVQRIAASGTISAPGVYGLSATGISVTITAPPWPYLAGFSITDETNAANPGQTITGPFARSPLTFNEAGQSETFEWDSVAQQFILT